MRTDILRPLGREHQLQLCLPAVPSAAATGRTIRLSLYRGPGRDFSERDRALLVASGHTNAQIARRLGVSEGRCASTWRTSTPG
jgi:DNA-binding NarL/FixJ family response regulator